MKRHALRTAVLALALPLLGVGLGSGCARQSEGEPCDAQGKSDDCESGLICTDSVNLLDPSADRCCPPTGGNITDGRCTLGGGPGGTGGAGGTSGSGGTSGADAGQDVGTGGTAGSAGTGGSAGAGTGGSAGTADSSIDSPTDDGAVDAPQTDSDSDAAADSAGE